MKALASLSQDARFSALERLQPLGHPSGKPFMKALAPLSQDARFGALEPSQSRAFLPL
jgi:hypothetical protein